MKRSRFTDEHIAYALRQVDGGTTVADVCRQMGISAATFCVWKKKYVNLGSTEIRSPTGVEKRMASTRSQRFTTSIIMAFISLC